MNCGGRTWAVCVDLLCERFHLLQPTVKPERGGRRLNWRSRKVVTMASVFDTAKYILGLHADAKMLPITTWKLQKLVYYGQAWSLVWDDRPLFDEPIEAWANGPVCPALYQAHKGMFTIDSMAQGRVGNLQAASRETLDIVFKKYGAKTAQYLSQLTHQERPWIEARKGLNAGDRGQRIITLDSMAEYYGGL